MNDQTPTDDLNASGYVPPRVPDPGQVPEPGRLPPGSRLPFDRNALFTGRSEPLLDLARGLLHGQVASALITQAIQGMGGIGKTQLAVEFAYRYGRFFHGVHWLNCAVPGAISAEIAVCGCGVHYVKRSWNQRRCQKCRQADREGHRK